MTRFRRGVREPGSGVLGQAHTWDRATAGVVLARLGPGRQPPLSFFTPPEEAAAEALLDHLLARGPEDPRIPVLSVIDARLSTGETDGWRYADVPEDGETWRRSLAALDADAALRHTGRAFAEIGHGDRHRLLRHVQDLGAGDWYGLPAAHVWTLWTRYACAAYYAHPYAWDEIGFGGPAYPRGYLRLGRGKREPWEEPR
ncbi:gluconate 2-dehydrogenase subunit 3 family protein [Streptomyces sp. ISL-11]|uniref:gluconate 2-dehydrogenase subunit 3 family protein n=1 Tax=Streptomyces sp. ISL-11 TaxID=2819174 RepID=UPI001BE7C707|nr:gluconate 2-dehydrogenase subunit 3 family protein [Streptomyces sp. ISL-11]MBT2387768.1 gluconate 2-dehydrogenase subunit 3 family protein [Streptomyces sp. ISL-11]